MTVLLLLQFCGVFAQQKELKFRNFTQEDGLPSNEAYTVFRDSRNYIWIATDQGVVRFNGLRMEHYSLPDNVVFKIREDQKGRIWFFTHTGRLSYFFNETVYPYKYNDSIAKYAKGLLITDAFVSPEGEIKINSSGGDYSNYDISPQGIIKKLDFFNGRNDTTVLEIKQTGPESYLLRRVGYSGYAKTMSVGLKDKNGSVLNTFFAPVAAEPHNHFGCVRNGRFFYMFMGKAVFRLDPDGRVHKKEFSSDILTLHASGANIWVGMIKNGAVFLNSELESVDGQHIFPGLSISSITADYEGGTWFSSIERGVFYLKSIQVYNLRGDDALLQPVSRIFNVHDSVLLFTNEKGIHKLEHNKVSLVLQELNDNISDLRMVDKVHRMIFLGGKAATVNKDYSAKKVPIHDRLADTVMVLQSSTEIDVSHTGSVITMFGHLIRKYDPRQAPKTDLDLETLFQNTLGGSKTNPKGMNSSMLFFDSNDNGWMSTPSMLFRISDSLDSIIPFKPSEPLFSKGITHMRQMQNGIYVIGMRTGGVALMKDTNIVANITEADGLLSNSVKFILPQEDKIWLATSKGVSVVHFQSFSPLRYTITNIGKNEGFSNLNIRQLEPYQGNMLAATENGIYVIEKPEDFLERPAIEIPLYINKINSYKGDTSGISSISVPYSHNRLQITYNAISFNSADEVKYFYRFERSDTTWQPLSGTELLLENLSPGIYNLELRAGIPSQQRFSQIRKLNIIIEEPWWQNVWLKIGGLLLLMIAGVIFYKVRIKTITRKANLRTMQKTKMIELEQTALRSQMNPHFIFNSLTSIQQLIVSNKAEQANEHLVKFARLIRKTLELSARPYIRINEEKEYLQEYLVLEQFRIPGEFEFNIEIDPQIDIFHTEIPNMMLQPIVENCIRHGIKHLENRKGLITIWMQLTGTVIRCTITDNGIGLNHSPENQSNMFFRQKSYGMEIVRKRLELLPGAEQRNTLPEITDLYDKNGAASGTMVSIELPYKIVTHD